MKKIKLTQGLYAIVDDEDFEELNQYKWYASKCYKSWYACRKISKNGKREKVYMHRVIMEPPNGVEIDHINRNEIDNRKENLRKASHRENLMNRRPNRGSSSMFKGVTLYKKTLKWASKIALNGKFIFLGYHKNEEDAARAYDKKAKELFGEFAYINFTEKVG